ncbi:hypothetical protein [Geminocystis sp. GBBB08]|uniref:hypothetical protein n=1 Tax=Geminocystis sp. GBBB08 TaxID=2604140 RepID=UPI0027E23020|nr:hypothetical protein [Geminocystis sp. GBBB08]MBL1209302.1 hypothetical protein [Geminocystis sp. GBBB08]
MNNQLSQGVIYIVTGENCVKEAYQSALSFKQKNPDIPITIFSDQKISSDYFEQIIPISPYLYNGHRQSTKILYLLKSPYKQTLYLDSDTYICDNIQELFTLLEQFDLAVSHASQRWNLEYKTSHIPDCFPEFNFCILLYKKSVLIEQLFSQWLSLYQRDLVKNLVSGYLPDQPTFREAIYNSKLRIATLTPEYNCRFITPGFVNKTVKILHGRHFDLLSIAEKINASNQRRIYYMDNWGNLQIVKHPQTATRVKNYIRFRQSLQQRGWKKTFWLLLKEIFKE